MSIFESYSTDVDLVVQHFNRLWIFPGGEEYKGSFEGAVNKARGYAHKYKGEMITVRFPKHIDDDPRDYSSFYVLIRK